MVFKRARIFNRHHFPRVKKMPIWKYTREDDNTKGVYQECIEEVWKIEVVLIEDNEIRKKGIQIKKLDDLEDTEYVVTSIRRYEN